jgi:hypothetical protein
MILVAIFSETGFFDYCAIKVGVILQLIIMNLIDVLTVLTLYF